MSDEFDDLLDVAVLNQGKSAATGGARRLRDSRAARLVSRLYAANAPLRARMLALLLRPLSPLGVAAIAAGAFASSLHRHGATWVSADDVGRYSNDQILELARFVEQVSPAALQQVADLVTSRPVGIATFSASAALLLLRAVQSRAAPRER